MNLARPQETVEHRSPLANWYDRATIRRSPRRVLAAEPHAGIFFPPELEPVANHPAVAARGAAARWRLLAERLHQYLTFTVELETTTVVPVTFLIARGRSGLELPGEMRADAFKVVTDEAWHAQFSYDLIEQVAAATGVPVPQRHEPAFIGRLARIAEPVPAQLRHPYALLSAVVSETLISALLAGLPHDKRLPGAVRETVADHAEDEGRHHAYFQQLLGFLWPALSLAERRQLGPLVPRLIMAYLEPDYPALHGALRRTGLTDSQAREVLADTYPPRAVRELASGAARATVKYFTEAGALGDDATYDAFASTGVLGDG